MGSIYRRKVRGKRQKIYTVKYVDVDGRHRMKSAFTDKESSRRLLQKLETEVARKRMGISDPIKKHVAASVQTHVDDYLAHIKAKGTCDAHQKQAKHDLEKAFKFMKVGSIADIEITATERFVLDMAREGLAVKTRNNAITNLKAFCNWLVTIERLDRNPLVTLKKANAEANMTRVRRAFTDDELRDLIKAALEQQVSNRLKRSPNTKPQTLEKLYRTGLERAFTYYLAAYTGLRRNELATLCWEHLSLKSTPAYITVEAKNSKSRRTDRIPMSEEVRARLLAWYKQKSKWNGTAPLPHDNVVHIPDKLHVHCKNDVKFAKLNPGKGKTLDFHCLRHTFASWLSRSGAPVRVAQTLVRHADSRTTQKIYTHVDEGDLSRAVNALPTLGMESESTDALQALRGPSDCDHICDHLCGEEGQNTSSDVNTDSKKEVTSEKDTPPESPDSVGSRDHVSTDVNEKAAHEDGSDLYARQGSNLWPLV